MKKNIIILFLFFLFCPNIVFAEDLKESLSGRILIQVEEYGEAWYVNPLDLKRYYLGRPQAAFEIMINLGQGISSSDLNKIPIGLNHLSGHDEDNDGLSDLFEEAIGTDKNNIDTDYDNNNDKTEIILGYDPVNGSGVKLVYNLEFARRQAGKIFLDIERHGEAWYVNPKDQRRYFLGRPNDAYNLMREKGLGITNNDIKKIPIGIIPQSNENNLNNNFTKPLYGSMYLDLGEIEELIFHLTNQEREKNGFSTLNLDSALSAVAREHSYDIARENKKFTGLGYVCDYPIIHHEGIEFGLYAADRLNNRGVYNFNTSGENIALISAPNINVRLAYDDPAVAELDACPKKRDARDESFEVKIKNETSAENKIAILEAELLKREEEFRGSKELEISQISWRSNETIANEVVLGWLNSEGHRKNMLHEQYTNTGVGAAYVNGYVIATQVYTREIDCGYKDGLCCEKAGYYPYCYIPLECISDICR